MNDSSVYDQSLIDRTIAYFEKKGAILTSEQAIEYLNSFADLYESFIEFAKKP